ncbi:MAG TPA: rubrerythrin family protein [Methanoregula sp.]|nr:rubrerythrin family protein [Methanoregula sp.]
MELKGSMTEKNLLAAFAGESQARNRYTFFASAARKEGYEQIAAIFLEISEQEKEHAKLFFRQLKGGEVEITASYPAGVIGCTKENLAAAAGGEKVEWGKLYPDFAATAEKEGFRDIADMFRKIATVEAHHEERFRGMLTTVEKNQVFSKGKATKWVCRNCGYVHEGKSAPDECPACKHPQAYFEVLVPDF